MLKNIFIVIVWVLIGSSGLFASPLALGGTDSELFSVVPERLALAQSDTARVSFFSGLSNPAAARSSTQHIIFSSQQQFALDTNAFTLHWILPRFEPIAVSAHFSQFQVSQIPIVPTESVSSTTDIEPVGFSNFSAYALNVSVGVDLGSGVSVGLASSWQYAAISQVEQARKWGVSLTPGLYWALSDDMKFGVAIPNIWSMYRWDTGYQESDSRAIDIGVAWGRSRDFRIFLMSKVPISRWVPTTFAVGGEYPLLGFFSLRGGLSGNRLSELCYGLGFGIEVGSFYLDYGYSGGQLRSDGSAIKQSLFAIGVAL